jgi:hypothetical protein
LSVWATTSAATASPSTTGDKVALSQVIKQIAQQVATANAGTNAIHIYQILVQSAQPTAVFSLSS